MKELSFAEEQLEKLVNKVVLKAYKEIFGKTPRKSRAKEIWYWAGTGLYQTAYDALYEKLVPKSGPADTTTGEVLRQLSKAYYRLYNDGDAVPPEVASLARAYVRDVPLSWEKQITW